VTRTAVVTITSGRDAHLHRQRAGLAADPPDVHVVVGMGERPDVPGIVVETPVPDTGLPLAAARNTGASAAITAGAEMLVFLDVDCIPGPGMLSAYRDAAGTVPGPSVLCGPVAYLPPAPRGGYPATGLAELAPPHPARPAPAPGEVWPEPRWELFWSLSFAVTAADWTRLGGFCEQYTGYGGEDTDFAVTAAAAGAALYWVGGATAFHQHHPPSRTTPGRVAEIVRNATLFRRRHGWWPMSGWLAELAEAGLVSFTPDGDTLELCLP
jgi:N-terminal domain of galactosyltransferase